MHLSIYNLHIDMSIPKDHVVEQAVDFAEAVCVSVRDRERQSARSRAPVCMKVSIHVFMYVSTNR